MLTLIKNQLRRFQSYHFVVCYLQYLVESNTKLNIKCKSNSNRDKI